MLTYDVIRDLRDKKASKPSFDVCIDAPWTMTVHGAAGAVLPVGFASRHTSVPGTSAWRPPVC